MEFQDSWWRAVEIDDDFYRRVYPSKGLLAVRSGIKVAWLLYDSKENAMECSPIAYREGIYYANQGYDFGYQSPGSVREVKDGWEVTIP
jgi:hypothetical protein